MPINSVNARVFLSAFKDIPRTTEIASSSTVKYISLTECLESVKNKLAILGDDRKKTEAKVNANKLSLEEIKNISEKYGENAIVRLKHGKFKYGYGCNFFKRRLFAIRYMLERLEVVDKFKLGGATVSVSESDVMLKKKINDGEHKLQSLRGDIDIYSERLELLERNSNITHPINTTPEEKTRKIESDKAKVREIFSTIYQSEAGCKALNAEARLQAVNQTSLQRLEGKDVVVEYKVAHSFDVFNDENEGVKVAIEEYCKALPDLVNIAADALYTPTSNNITTYRGQGMTENGIVTLINQSLHDEGNNTKTVYKPGQFFSTSPSVKAAFEFADNSPDNVKVIFEVKGNSSHGLTVPGGLAFRNHKGERLYSPHANFEIAEISRVSSADIYRMVLQEVAKADGARLLPY